MKRVHRYYIDDKDRSRMEDAASHAKCSASEFVREAVIEKIDRSEVSRQIADASGQLAGLLHELRGEVGRIRQDLMKDQARSTDLMQQQIDKSLKRNEELAKSFVMTLTRVLGEGGSGGSVYHDEHAPMQIPG